ncbi:MAG: hypothetical protein VST68_12725 [Nitrospirota bacterium]|nr:hypothetical protein [Nitrospirota bacterium]
MGFILNCVMAYERGEWDVVPGNGVEAECVKTAYFEAISWSSYLLPLTESEG